MHGCVKRMADAMLDLITPGTAERVVTRSASGDGATLGEEFIERRRTDARPAIEPLRGQGPTRTSHRPIWIGWWRVRRSAATRCPQRSCRPSRVLASTIRSNAVPRLTPHGTPPHPSHGTPPLGGGARCHGSHSPRTPLGTPHCFVPCTPLTVWRVPCDCVWYRCGVVNPELAVELWCYLLSTMMGAALCAQRHAPDPLEPGPLRDCSTEHTRLGRHTSDAGCSRLSGSPQQSTHCVFHRACGGHHVAHCLTTSFGPCAALPDHRPFAGT
jgi:hypothetical protein